MAENPYRREFETGGAEWQYGPRPALAIVSASSVQNSSSGACVAAVQCSAPYVVMK